MGDIPHKYRRLFIRGMCTVGYPVSTMSQCTDLHHVDADPDPTFHFDVDPDPSFHCNEDPDPTFHFDADPDPTFLCEADLERNLSRWCGPGSGSCSHQIDANLRPLAYRPPRPHFESPASIVGVHGLFSYLAPKF